MQWEVTSQCVLSCETVAVDLQAAKLRSHSLSIDGRLVARAPLTEDPNIPATYNADIASLPAGNYQVTLEAAGFSRGGIGCSYKLCD